MERDFDLSIEIDCTLLSYTQEVLERCEEFSCGNKDLDDFFRSDVFLYENEMLGKSYCWVTNSKPHKIVALVTIANDSIKSSVLPTNSRNRFNRIFNNQKRNLTYPATLIGRLGVNSSFQGHHIGRQVMDFIKLRSVVRYNLNGCRFLVVDAHNNPDTLQYYEHNGFSYMHKDEEIERIALRRYNENGELIHDVPQEEELQTRMMYFDLKKMSSSR